MKGDTVPGLVQIEVARRVQDEDDLALSAINALYAGAKEGRFRKLENRDDLWQILVMITSRKASNLRRKQHIREEAGESVLLNQANDPTAAGIAEVLVGASCEEMLSQLDEKLREVALLKLAGHTNEEIAQMRNRNVKSVERYLQMIRVKWQI